jgi:hypothetical protein
MSQSFFDPPPPTKYTVLNLGAGVQSSALALMAAKGEVGPMPDFAVFADTQAEPTGVYRWLDWLETKLPFPVIRVTKGNLTEDSLKVRFKKSHKYGDVSYLKRIIPAFGISDSGEFSGMLGRACTADYKVQPIVAEIKRRCKIKKDDKAPVVTQWIGISYDEMQRMKLPNKAWTQHRWPLIEKRMTRGHCIEWMQKTITPSLPGPLVIIARSIQNKNGGGCEMRTRSIFKRRLTSTRNSGANGTKTAAECGCRFSLMSNAAFARNRFRLRGGQGPTTYRFPIRMRGDVRPMNERLLRAAKQLAEAVRLEREYKLIFGECPKDDIEKALDEFDAAYNAANYKHTFKPEK